MATLTKAGALIMIGFLKTVNQEEQLAYTLPVVALHLKNDTLTARALSNVNFKAPLLLSK